MLGRVERGVGHACRAARDQHDDGPAQQAGQPREHPPPRRFWPPYPTFDPAALRQQFAALGEPWDAQRCLSALTRYHRNRRIWLAMEALYALGLVLAVVLAVLLALFVVVSLHIPGSGMLSAAVLACSLFVLPRLCLALFWWPADAARPRFFRTAGLVVRTLRRQSRPDNPQLLDQTELVNRLGLAARELFAVVQRRRWTWTSPPAVSDRALRLAYPLLNVDLPDDFGLTSPAHLQHRLVLARLISEAACMVAIRREDLLPRVRDRYRDEIPVRCTTDDISDRDALHLDPMRTRTRWEIAKDHIVPMIALGVSLVSLLVSLAK